MLDSYQKCLIFCKVRRQVEVAIDMINNVSENSAFIKRFNIGDETS